MDDFSKALNELFGEPPIALSAPQPSAALSADASADVEAEVSCILKRAKLLDVEATALRARAKELREEAAVLHLLRTQRPLTIHCDSTLGSAEYELEHQVADMMQTELGLRCLQSHRPRPDCPAGISKLQKREYRSARDEHRRNMVIWLHEMVEKVRGIER